MVRHRLEISIARSPRTAALSALRRCPIQTELSTTIMRDRAAFTHGGKIAFPAEARKIADSRSLTMPSHQSAQRLLDGGPLGRKAGRRHCFLQQLLVQLDIRTH
jgi:hypothetical protein